MRLSSRLDPCPDGASPGPDMLLRRSNADAFAGFHGADAPVVAEIVEPKVQVTFIPAGATSAPAGSKAQAPAPPPKAPLPAERGGELERRRERSRSRSRDRRRRSHSRERRRSRSRSRDRQRRRSRSRSRDRRRDGSRERRRRDEEPRGGAAAEPAPAQQQQEEERVDVESTEGAVLEVVREGKSLGRCAPLPSRPAAPQAPCCRCHATTLPDSLRASTASAPAGLPCGPSYSPPAQRQRPAAPLPCPDPAAHLPCRSPPLLPPLPSSPSLPPTALRSSTHPHPHPSAGHLVVELRRVSQECVFGRMPSCDVQLEHLSISRAHAQLTTDGAGNLFVTDMGSGEAACSWVCTVCVWWMCVCVCVCLDLLGCCPAGLRGLPGCSASCALCPWRQQPSFLGLEASIRATSTSSTSSSCSAAHGTNVDDAWIKAKVPKQLRVGSVFKFGASVRQYKVAKLPQRTAARR